MKALDNFHKDYTIKPGNLQEEIRVDPEFANKIPPIGDDEFDQLRENILAAGEVYEALVVWNGVLVDGHNRWKVIQEHPEVKWSVRTMDFPDKWAAFEWMYKNQLGRRNLTDEQRIYTIGKMYEARKKSSGGQIGNNNAIKRDAQSGQLVSTTDKEKHGVSGELAVELNIGRNTVRRAEKFAKGVDALREVSPEAAEKVLSGKANVTKKDVQSISKMPPKAVESAAKAIVNGKPIGATEDRPKPKRETATKIDDTMMRVINSLRDPNASQAFNLDDLIEEITLSGSNYVRGLRETIAIRTYLLDDEDAKGRVFKAIASIMQDIAKVRGEFVK
jgi:hypothetical protein